MGGPISRNPQGVAIGEERVDTKKRKVTVRFAPKSEPHPPSDDDISDRVMMMLERVDRKLSQSDKLEKQNDQPSYTSDDDENPTQVSNLMRIMERVDQKLSQPDKPERRNDQPSTTSSECYNYKRGKPCAFDPCRFSHTGTVSAPSPKVCYSYRAGKPCNRDPCSFAHTGQRQSRQNPNEIPLSNPIRAISVVPANPTNCAQMSRMSRCTVPRCTQLHGNHKSENVLCRTFHSKAPCPHLWTERGCGFSHDETLAKN